MADLVDDNFTAGGDSSAAEKRKRKREKNKEKRDRKKMKMAPPEEKKDWDSESLAALLSKFVSTSLDKTTTIDPSRVKTTGNKESLFSTQTSNLPLHLAELFEDNFSKLTTKSEDDKPGHPKVIVISSSALRAVALHKTCSEMHKKVLVGKMFAKHIKIKEQQDFLKSKISHILIGTPNRLATLTQNGSICLDGVKFVVFDSWKNAKGFSLFEVREVGKDLASFLDGELLEKEIDFSFL